MRKIETQIIFNIFFEVEMRKKEMRKIAELKDSYLDCRRRAGSEEAYIARYKDTKTVLF